ncbi:MAG: DivIVA domain-containing protein, partial [Clostridia bacterium]
EYESVYKENERLRQRIQELEAELAEYSRTEAQIDELLALAKQTAADVKEAAQHEAESLLKEAKLKAREIVAAAEAKARADGALLERLRFEGRQYRAAVERAAEDFLSRLDELLASVERWREAPAVQEAASAWDDGDAGERDGGDAAPFS